MQSNQSNIDSVGDPVMYMVMDTAMSPNNVSMYALNIQIVDKNAVNVNTIRLARVSSCIHQCFKASTHRKSRNQIGDKE
jgi:hypothetical protein